MNLCLCGCGKEVSKERNKFVNGHWIRTVPAWNKGKKWSKKTKKKMSLSAIKKFEKNPELRKKCGWNKLTFKRLKEIYPVLFKEEKVIKDRRGDPLVKCKVCKKYFKPTYTQLGERLRAIKNPVKNIRNYFYCSEKCKRLCRFYNRHIDPDNTYDISEYNNYVKSVFSETERTVKIYKDKIRNLHLRGLRKGYDLDHKFSIFDGFVNSVDPKIIAHWKNLEILKKNKNRSKWKKSSITKEQLFSGYGELERK